MDVKKLNKSSGHTTSFLTHAVNGGIMVTDDILRYVKRSPKKAAVFAALATLPFAAYIYIQSGIKTQGNPQIAEEQHFIQDVATNYPFTNEKATNSSFPNGNATSILEQKQSPNEINGSPLEKKIGALRPDKHARKKGANNKLSPDERVAYNRIVPFYDDIKEIEAITFLTGFKYVVGAESDFIPGRVSKRDACNISQVLPSTVDSLINQMEDDKKILSKILDLNLVERIKLTNYFSDIDIINLDQLGFNEDEFLKIKKEKDDKNKDKQEKYRRKDFQKEQIRSVILPRYLKTKELFPDYSIDKEKALFDPHYNLRVGGANHLSNYLELSSLQLIKKIVEKDGEQTIEYKWIYRPRTFFNGRENLKAFTDADIMAAYNCGCGRIKKIYINSVKEGHYGISERLYAETKTHAKRIKVYAERFKKFFANNLLRQ